MNKYEKAFNHLREHASFDTVDEMIDIKELVEKAIPAKPIHEEVQSKFNEDFYHEFWFCPNCKKIIMRKDEHCFNCGQAIDWRYEDGKTTHNL